MKCWMTFCFLIISSGLVFSQDHINLPANWPQNGIELTFNTTNYESGDFCQIKSADNNWICFFRMNETDAGGVYLDVRKFNVSERFPVTKTIELRTNDSSDFDWGIGEFLLSNKGEIWYFESQEFGNVSKISFESGGEMKKWEYEIRDFGAEGPEQLMSGHQKWIDRDIKSNAAENIQTHLKIPSSLLYENYFFFNEFFSSSENCFRFYNSHHNTTGSVFFIDIDQSEIIRYTLNGWSHHCSRFESQLGVYREITSPIDDENSMKYGQYFIEELKDSKSRFEIVDTFSLPKNLVRKHGDELCLTWIDSNNLIVRTNQWNPEKTYVYNFEQRKFTDSIICLWSENKCNFKRDKNVGEIIQISQANDKLIIQSQSKNKAGFNIYGINEQGLLYLEGTFSFGKPNSLCISDQFAEIPFAYNSELLFLLGPMNLSRSFLTDFSFYWIGVRTGSMLEYPPYSQMWMNNLYFDCKNCPFEEYYSGTNYFSQLYWEPVEDKSGNISLKSPKKALTDSVKFQSNNAGSRLIINCLKPLNFETGEFYHHSGWFGIDLATLNVDQIKEFRPYNYYVDFHQNPLKQDEFHPSAIEAMKDFDSLNCFTSEEYLNQTDFNLLYKIQNELDQYMQLEYATHMKTDSAIHFILQGDSEEGDPTLVFYYLNYENGKSHVVNFSFASNREWMFYCDDNYYYASPHASSTFSCFHEGRSYYLENFELRYSRPDIILERLGYADKRLIAAYRSAYLKRLDKLGFTEEMVNGEIALPEIEILNRKEIQGLTEKKEVILNIEAFDSINGLEKINVWINDVAIFGYAGLKVPKAKELLINKELTIELAQGENTIAVAAVSKSGATSYKERVVVQYVGETKKPRLFLVSLGVSSYQDDRYNLNYATKDAIDVASLFEKKSKHFDDVFSLVLTDEEVVSEALIQIQKFLDQAEIDDQVMIFIAGHGVLDEQFDYYFATHDMNFLKPSENGISYEALEKLLDGIKPLKKLLFMDTCHSGELDKDEIEIAQEELSENEEIVFRNVGPSVEKKSRTGMENTSAIMSNLFLDLRKGTGATVISSAGGAEFALESGKWENGLFTYCFLNGLRSKNADLNQDGDISVNEIQRYLHKEVYNMSGGIQVPTYRIENVKMDYTIW